MTTTGETHPRQHAEAAIRPLRVGQESTMQTGTLFAIDPRPIAGIIVDVRSIAKSEDEMPMMPVRMGNSKVWQGLLLLGRSVEHSTDGTPYETRPPPQASCILGSQLRTNLFRDERLGRESVAFPVHRGSSRRRLCENCIVGHKRGHRFMDGLQSTRYGTAAASKRQARAFVSMRTIALSSLVVPRGSCVVPATTRAHESSCEGDAAPSSVLPDGRVVCQATRPCSRALRRFSSPTLGVQTGKIIPTGTIQYPKTGRGRLSL
jgi:hypothetical protein